MLGFPNFTPFRRHAAALLAIGLFAMAIQALGGIGLMPRLSAGTGFQLEICTGKGLSTLAMAPQSGPTSPPDTDHRDCCTLCAASAPLLLAEALLGVLPAPAFGNIFVAGSVPRLSAPAWLAHRPRGPPQA